MKIVDKDLSKTRHNSTICADSALMYESGSDGRVEEGTCY